MIYQNYLGSLGSAETTLLNLSAYSSFVMEEKNSKFNFKNTRQERKRFSSRTRKCKGIEKFYK